MVALPTILEQFAFKVLTDGGEYGPEKGVDFSGKHPTSVLCDKDQVNMQVANHVPARSPLLVIRHRPKHGSYMEIVQAYRFKARPTAAQASLFRQTAGCCRTLYNAGLEQRTRAWRQQRRSLRYADQAAELTELKEAFPWMKEAPSHCLQQSLMDLGTAFSRFFTGKSGYPRFKKKGVGDSFRFPDKNQITLLPARGEKGRVKLPKVGVLSFVQHRAPQGEIRNVTLTREADGWYISICTMREVNAPEPPSGEPIGIDLGVTNTVTISGGRGRLKCPGAMAGERKRLVRLQKKLARQQKRSRSRQDTKDKIARLYLRLKRRRSDFLHKLTHNLAKNHGVVVVEGLKVRSMTASARGTRENPGTRVRQKAGLNRAILEQGWGEFRRQLKYKMAWRGGEYVALKDVAGTSRECPECEHAVAGNRPSQAVFLCVNCGYAAHADDNAANNILARGLRVTAGGAFAQAGGP